MSPLDDLRGVVAPQVLTDAIEVSSLLTDLGVPHALAGGLAVGIHGFPRATRDVDFLVGDEAFDSTSPVLTYRPELRERVRVGVVDLMSVPPRYPCLSEQLRVADPGQLPVVAPEALILMKLAANRPQDRADVARLLSAGLNPDRIATYVADNAPELLQHLATIVDGRS